MRALLAALVVLAAAPAAAHGQAIAFGGEGRILSAVQIPVRASGSLAVTWGSDPATCAPVGRCGLDGVTTWTAPPAGSLYAVEQLVDGRRERAAFLALHDFGGGESVVRSRVRRATPEGSRVCTDASPGATFLDLGQERGRVQLGVLEPGNEALLTSRCGGPALADVTPAVPALRVPYSRVLSGRSRIRLGGEGAFSAAGFAGRARSTLTLRLGRPRTDQVGRGTRVTTGRRFYGAEVRYRVVEVRGEVGVDLAGSNEPAECTLLDSCGLVGSLRLAPVAQKGEVWLTSEVPRARGRRGARAALGLEAGGAPPDADVYGYGDWEGPGRVEVSVTRPEGGEPCTDAIALEGGSLGLEVEGERVRVTYGPGTPGLRCPGPYLDFAEGAAFADVPLTELGAERVELTLAGSSTARDQGWSATTRPALTVVLQRTRVREFAFRRPY